MALEKTISTKFGIDANYWAVIDRKLIIGDTPDFGKCNYVLGGWPTREIKYQKNAPLQKIIITLDKDYKDDWDGLYKKIKTESINGKEIFSGAKDVLEKAKKK